jgi:hypothetical protein
MKPKNINIITSFDVFVLFWSEIKIQEGNFDFNNKKHWIILSAIDHYAREIFVENKKDFALTAMEETTLNKVLDRIKNNPKKFEIADYICNYASRLISIHENNKILVISGKMFI